MYPGLTQRSQRELQGLLNRLPRQPQQPGSRNGRQPGLALPNGHDRCVYLQVALAKASLVEYVALGVTLLLLSHAIEAGMRKQTLTRQLRCSFFSSANLSNDCATLCAEVGRKARSSSAGSFERMLGSAPRPRPCPCRRHQSPRWIRQGQPPPLLLALAVAKTRQQAQNSCLWMKAQKSPPPPQIPTRRHRRRPTR